MPDQKQLEVIVQRMIDAGEPEDAIAGVIREYPKHAAPEPSEGIGGVLGGAASRIKENWEGIKNIAGASVDVMRNLGEQGDVASATRQGFLQGAKEGPKQLWEQIKSGDALKEFVGGKNESGTYSERLGRGAVDVGALLLGGGATNATRTGIKVGAEEGIQAGLRAAAKQAINPAAYLPFGSGKAKVGGAAEEGFISPAGTEGLTKDVTVAGSIPPAGAPMPKFGPAPNLPPSAPVRSSTVPPPPGAGKAGGAPRLVKTPSNPLLDAVSSGIDDARAPLQPGGVSTPPVAPGIPTADTAESVARQAAQGRAINPALLETPPVTPGAPPQATGRLVPGGQPVSAPPQANTAAAIQEALAELAPKTEATASAPVIQSGKGSPMPLAPEVESAPSASGAAEAASPDRAGHFKLPEVKDPVNALAAAESNDLIKSNPMMPEPVTDAAVEARMTDRRQTAGQPPARDESALMAELQKNRTEIERLHTEAQTIPGERWQEYEALNKQISDLALKNRAIHEQLNAPTERRVGPRRAEGTGSLQDRIDRELQDLGVEIEGKSSAPVGQARPMADVGAADTIAANPATMNAEGYSAFRKSELEAAGVGEPGLKVDQGLGGDTRITVFGEDGSPLATARVVPTPSGNQVYSIASAEGKGLGTGRAVMKVVEEVKKLNPVGAIAGMSPEAQTLVSKLEGVGKKKATSTPKQALTGLAKTTAEGAGSATMTPGEMRNFYGTDEAARRMGVPKDEFLQLADPNFKKPHSDFPAKAESAQMDEAYRNHIADDGPYLYSGADPAMLWKQLKKHPVIGSATIGGTIGGLTGDENSNTLKRILAGALTGAGVGFVGKDGPTGVRKNLNQIRMESMLSGAAIPKNIATGVGSVLRAQLENLGAQAPLTNSPIKEMFRVPTNMREFAKAWGNPQAGIAHQPVKGPMGRTIGAIDQTFDKIHQRSGLDKHEITRLLLNADNDFGKMIGADTGIGETLVPFQRTPANSVREGFRDLSHATRQGQGGEKPMRHVSGVGRAAGTIGSVIAGREVGKWAKEDPVRRGLLAAILLSATGPGIIPAGMGALSVNAPRTAVGGLSPVPETAFEPLKSSSGITPAFVTFLKRLRGEGPERREP